MENDNNLILSHCCWIRLLVTSMNVIHSWGIYSLGWKFDGIPGILNGIYYHLYFIGFFNGLCYELCGLLHNFKVFNSQLFFSIWFHQMKIKLSESIESVNFIYFNNLYFTNSFKDNQAY